jgi:ABC-type glycerol-3-phosphate transport system substrate-binding protein
MPRKQKLSRRRAVQLGAAAAALPMVHIRTAGAAGKLAVGFWDHWVPKGNEILRKQIQTWADKNKVDVAIDFITSVGYKLELTAAEEAQAGEGHDALQLFSFGYAVGTYADKLEPVDDAIKAITEKWGPYYPAIEYLGKINGHWMAIPTSTLTSCRPSLARISLMREIAGIDVQGLYPGRKMDPPEGEAWTYDAFLKAAEACKKAGYGFGLGIGSTYDSVGNAAVWFASFGADPVDSNGNITVHSEKMLGFLEWAKKLVKVLPDDALSYDDASDNRLIIAGKTALIFDPPSPYAVAKRDAPQMAADMWSFPCPSGPAGRFIPYGYAFSGIWKFSKNKSAAKDLLIYLSGREQFEERCRTVEGFDIPVLSSMADSNVWDEIGPPAGVMYNFPLRPWHQAVALVPGYPAPLEIAAKMTSRATMPNMLARLYRGQSTKQVVNWAQNELEGFSR